MLALGWSRSSIPYEDQTSPTPTPASRPRRRTSTTPTASTSSARSRPGPRERPALRDPRPRAGRRRRRRGPHVLDQPRHRPQGHHPRRVRTTRRAATTQGGSTITQQYVKILYLSQERSWTRKLKEAILSLKIHNQRVQAGDPRGLPQHHLLRQRRLRRRGRLRRRTSKVRQAAERHGGRSAGRAHQLPQRLRPGERQGLQAGAARPLRVRPRRHGRHGDHCRRSRASSTLYKLPPFPQVDADQRRTPARPGYLLRMVREELQADRLLRLRDRRAAGCGSSRPSPDKAMQAAAAGASRPSRSPTSRTCTSRVASVDPATGALRGMYAGQDYLKSQINWAVAGGASPDRRSSRSRWRPGSTTATR